MRNEVTNLPDFILILDRLRSAHNTGNIFRIAEALGAEGKEAYDLILSSITSGTATYIYETEHALVNRPLTPDMMTYDGNRIELDLGDVPYLLYEDFTDASVTSHDDDYTPGLNSDTNLKGINVLPSDITGFDKRVYLISP